MDFTFNEEQTLIQDQVDQFVQKEYDWETRQSLSNSDLGFGESNWQKFAELGWLGISVSEDSGGFGGSAIESMLIMEAFGKGLVVEPFLETMIMAGSLIDDYGSDEQKSSILEPAISGEMHLALAYAEPQSRFNLSDVVTEAKAEGENYILNGYKSVVRQMAATWGPWAHAPIAWAHEPMTPPWALWPTVPWAHRPVGPCADGPLDPWGL